MTTILYESQKQDQTPPRRPAFLTVLCVLTFVGSGIAILGAVYSYLMAERAAMMFDTSMGNPGEAAQLGILGETQIATLKAAQNALPNLLVGIIAPLLCVFGAIRMWKQYKTGFYIYCTGELLGPLSALFLGAGTMLEMLGIGGRLFIAIVFIIMYAVNLRHMK